jgi:hypothetical protein
VPAMACLPMPGRRWRARRAGVVPRPRLQLQLPSPPSWRSRSSAWSVVSAYSAFSAGSVLSAGGFLSALSIASAGSLLSLGSSGSILSVGSTGSILSVGSAGSILSIGSSGSVLGVMASGGTGADHRPRAGNPVARVIHGTATILGATALIAAASGR